LAYLLYVIIVETSVFTRQIDRLLDSESYRDLQNYLVDDPNRGSVIPGTAGLRKLRWQRAGAGKRGGIRVIYFWIVNESTVLMLLAYPKGEQDDLTPGQKRTLKQIVEEELK
jgi:mRNA-degrading endonuclease RelE of RelBE toxin-antitoxin system